MTAKRRWLLAACLTFLVGSAFAAPPGTKRALLIGINDYSASNLTTPSDAEVPMRDWSNLDGTVNDVRLMRELLVKRHDFAAADVLVLTDQQATRKAIEKAIAEHLLRPAKQGDVLLFYYSGHGSQVRNSLSTEADKLDESLVPADSRRGARDIRDKELAAAFNQMLDRGARVTVVLDACHSGSGARGLSGGLRHRGVRFDPRDVADASVVARPESRGALVLAAAEDFDLAYETMTADQQIHGAFSWALARALRDAEPGEPASETFLRAQARVRAEAPAQNPVLAGRNDSLGAPFLGMSVSRGARRAIAVESVSTDGTCTLLGGWVHGLTVGTRLRATGDHDVELQVTSLIGAGRAEARVVVDREQRTSAASLRPGSLLEISTWAAPPARRLRVWIPRAPAAAIGQARKHDEEARSAGVLPIDDPTQTTPARVVRWRGKAWERLSGGEDARSSLFVQVPATTTLADAIGAIDGVERVDGPDTAEYILTGRFTKDGVEYAWVRPGALGGDSARSVMPSRTAWTAPGGDDSTASALRAAMLQLVRVHGWHELQSPPGSASHYRLGIRALGGGGLLQHSGEGPLVGGRGYQLVLRLRNPPPAAPLQSRYVYVFIIDSHGRGVLLFPHVESGSVENRLPLVESAAQAITDPPAEIPLADGPSFVVSPPYGIDTYFLLSTETPLSSTACLEWDGSRSVPIPLRTPLETLLARSASGTRGEPLHVPQNWSIEKIALESVPPKKGSR